MIFIIIGLVQPPLNSHPFLRNFANEEQSSILGVVRKEKYLRYLAKLAVNVHPQELRDGATKFIAASGAHSKNARTNMSVDPHPKEGSISHHHILLEEGPEGYAKYRLERVGLLLMDNTWRNAHQSILATCMRTQDLTNAAKPTNLSLRDAFSLDMWGGATSDVNMRLLQKNPCECLETLREKVPDVPFQMMLCGANAVGYTNYTDNLFHKFCKHAFNPVWTYYASLILSITLRT